MAEPQTDSIVTKQEDILTGLPELGLAQPALVPNATGPWAADLVPPQPVSGPRIFSLQDRQVHVQNDDVCLYVTARKWIQNLPEEHPLPPEPASLQLPGLLKAENQEPAPPPPAYVDQYTTTNYEPEEVLRLMKMHWINVRQHWQQQGKERMKRQQARLAPWLQAVPLPNAAPAVPPAVPNVSLLGLPNFQSSLLQGPAPMQM